MNSRTPADNDQSTPTMGELLAQGDYDFEAPQRGDLRSGTIIAVRPDEIVVDIGAKREGLVQSRDLENLSAEELAKLKPGDEVTVYIVTPEDARGNLIVSLHLAHLEEDWARVEANLDSQEIFEVEVTGHNKGGLIAPIGRLRGFIPASQLSNFPRYLPHEEKLTRLKGYVGQSLPVRVIEVDRARRRLIMSERVAQREWQEKKRRDLLQSLTKGEVVRGTVTSLTSFGAFVDLGGADGLIHISELSWEHVNHPRDLLRVGQEIDVYILDLDHEKKRIVLSRRLLQPNPWNQVQENYTVGMKVAGTITKIVDFGAFAQIEEGVEGLIHNSEISDEPFEHPGDVLHPDEHYLLEIINLEPERQRIGLSLRRVPADEQAAWQAARGSDVQEPAPASFAPVEQAVPSAPEADAVADATHLPDEVAHTTATSENTERADVTLENAGPDA